MRMKKLDLISVLWSHLRKAIIINVIILSKESRREKLIFFFFGIIEFGLLQLLVGLSDWYCS